MLVVFPPSCPLPDMMNFKDLPQHQDVEWRQQLQNLVRLQIICAATTLKPKEADLPFVYQTISALLRNASQDPTPQNLADRQLKHAPSRNQWLLAHLFHDNDPARTAFFTRSSLFQRARRESLRPTRSTPTLPTTAADEAEAELRQQSAKLHCLYGRPILNGGRTRSSRMYPFACAKVYDLRQYTTAAHWGPFRNDGSDRVDWEKVEAVLIVLGSNLRTTQSQSFSLHNIWDAPFAGSWSGSWVPSPARSLTRLDAEDPYGISGTWLRVGCRDTPRKLRETDIHYRLFATLIITTSLAITSSRCGMTFHRTCPVRPWMSMRPCASSS